jgi:hypothetical protein
MKKYINILIILIVSIGCKKDQFYKDDTFGRLTGKITVKPSEFYSGSTVLKNKALHLYNDTSEYFFLSNPIGSNNQFEFIFQRQPEKNYYFKHIDTFGGLIYKVDTGKLLNTNNSNISLELFFDSIQNNILSIAVYDSSGNYLLNNALVKLFANEYLAKIKNDNYMVANATMKNGKANFINLKKDIYYANVSIKLDNDSIFENIAKPIDFSNGRILRDSMWVRRK